MAARRQRPLRIDMSRMHEQPPDPSEAQLFKYSEIPIHKNVECFVSDNENNAVNNFKCAIVNIRLGQDGEDMDDFQRSVYFMGPIVNLLTSTKDPVKRALAGVGVNVQYKTLPRDLEGTGVDWPDEVPDVRMVAAYLGVSVLFLYKNVTAVSYPDYLRNRVKALCNICSMSETDSKLVKDYFASIAHAEAFKSCIGNNFTIRKEVCQSVRNKHTGMDVLTDTCIYLARLLCWTDMSALLFVNQTLLVCNSPVLLQWEVASELSFLDRAFKAITASPAPQYYRLLADRENHRDLERNHFKLLLAVSQEIRAEISPTVRRFQTVKNVNPELVKNLVNIHKMYFRGHVNLNMQFMVRRITNQKSARDIADEEEEAATHLQGT